MLEYLESFMKSDLEYRGKGRLLMECKRIGLPINDDDKIETLELVFSLAKANNWNYRGSESERDKMIERTIKKIRNFIEYGTYSIIN